MASHDIKQTSAGPAAHEAGADEATCLCDQHGHLWGDPYSFGGRSWHRDCYRCYECEDVSAQMPATDVQVPYRIVRLLSA